MSHQGVPAGVLLKTLRGEREIALYVPRVARLAAWGDACHNFSPPAASPLHPCVPYARHTIWNFATGLG